jgi:uncharacterized protein
VRIVVSGASGLIGSALTRSLRDDDHTVIALVRREARSADESAWDPAAYTIDRDVIASADVVVNLAGASIGSKRLTSTYKRVVMESRVDSTAIISRAIADANPHVVLLQGSSMGYYGGRGSTELTEGASPGKGFLADVCQAWEASTQPAVDAGAKVAYLRTGLVLAGHGGFAQRLLPFAKRGLLGSLGSRTALQPWITLEDHVRGLRSLMDSAHRGPVNMVAPRPATMAEIVGAIAGAYGKRSGLPVPGWVLRLVIGEAAEDLLNSQAGVPAVLTDRGFAWTHPTLELAAHYVAADSQ